MAKSKPIDLAEARASVSYNPDTGIFRWLISKRGHRKAGDIAGSRRKGARGGSYWRVKIDQRTYGGGRLAWVLHYGREPEGEVDHADGDGLNNRILNLRDVSHFQNCQNVEGPGVRFEPDRGRWLARICFDGKTINLGRFKEEGDARAAYVAAAKRLRGEFARAP